MSLAIQEHISLAEMTTLKIGGRARYFIEITNENEIAEALTFAENKKIKVFVLGGGSNVLIADEGFDGLVIKIAISEIKLTQINEKMFAVEAGAGENWDLFCKFCVEKNLQGIESLSGIPGLVGGTPVQNVGAYGQEVSETITKVKCFDRIKKKFVEMTNADCKFGYRTSIFNTTDKNRFVITAVTFNLNSGGAPKIEYRDLQNYFGNQKPNLEQLRKAVIEIRKEKSMVIDQNDPNSKSVGSFFKNPILSHEKFAEIKANRPNLNTIEIPFYKVDDKFVKIPAAWLIENSGIKKGFRLGRAGISTKHTLALINSGDSNAKEILKLKEYIQDKVKQKFGIELKKEPVFVGFKSDQSEN